MLAPITPGDTTQWAVQEWVWEQAQFLPSPMHTLVLAYLASKSFYEEDNPEGGEVGQVMRQYSYAETMLEATGIKSRTTLRNVLNDLQDMAYIQRGERKKGRLYGQQPHLIYVLWEHDELRQEIRDGKPLPVALMDRPTRPKRASKPDLRVVEMPVSINS